MEAKQIDRKTVGGKDKERAGEPLQNDPGRESRRTGGSTVAK